MSRKRVATGLVCEKCKLIITEQAIEDLMAIWLYIASYSIRNADRFIDFLYEKCFALCDIPHPRGTPLQWRLIGG